MRKAIGFFSLSIALAMAGAAHADRWKIYHTSYGAVAYDEDSIRADIATGLSSIDIVVHNTASQMYEGVAYNYMAARHLYQCRAGTYRRVRQVIMDPQAGGMKDLPDTEWLPVDLGASEAFRRVACTMERPPASAEASDVLSLLPMMAQPAASPPRPAAGEPRAPADGEAAARLRQ